jgi:hypothetical protein
MPAVFIEHLRRMIIIAAPRGELMSLSRVAVGRENHRCHDVILLELTVEIVGSAGIASCTELGTFFHFLRNSFPTV